MPSPYYRDALRHRNAKQRRSLDGRFESRYMPIHKNNILA